MLDELNTDKKYVGFKQSERAVSMGTVKKAFVAKNADLKITGCFEKKCLEHNIPVVYVQTKEELGRACKIDVNVAVAVLLK